MPEYLADLARVSASGTLPGGEQWVNVFHVERGTPSGDPFTLAELGPVATAIRDFYLGFDQLLSSEWSLTQIQSRDQQAPDGPVFDHSITPVTGGVSGDDLPNQVALVITWLTALGGRRNRGRTYLCGFVEASSVQSSPFAAGIDATQRNTIGSAAATLIGTLAAGNLDLVVFSRTGGHATPINRARVGVTWDTQRRRRNRLGEAYAIFTPPLP